MFINPLLFHGILGCTAPFVYKHYNIPINKIILTHSIVTGILVIIDVSDYYDYDEQILMMDSTTQNRVRLCYGVINYILLLSTFNIGVVLFTD